MPDDLEIAIGLSSDDVDTDDDGLSDFDEFVLQATSPLLIDSDGDSLQDGTEFGVSAGLLGDPQNGIFGTDSGVFQPDMDVQSTTDPMDVDSDDDGISDGGEDSNFDGMQNGAETAPEQFDSDHDGMRRFGPRHWHRRSRLLCTGRCPSRKEYLLASC